ncbi:MAG: Crp/Fnr family transcriptional regulator [Geminicoccaceae bacterium]
MSGDRSQEILAAFQASEVFAAADPAALRELLAFGSFKSYRAGQAVFHRGDPGNSLFVVLSGRIKISNMSIEGREAVHNFLDPGQILGEIAILDGRERSADATCSQPSEVFVLQRRDVLPFFKKHPDVAISVIELLCTKLRRASEMAEDSIFLQLGPKVAKGLLRLAETYGEDVEDGIKIDFKLNQRELGGFVGAARENVNRQLKAWREEGLIENEDGYVTILDMDTILAIAEGLE